MRHSNPALRSAKHRHLPWLLLLAGATIGAYLLFRPTRGGKEARIIAPDIKKGNGHRVEVPIVIDTAGQTINAAQIFLKFDPNQAAIESLDKAGTFFTVWVKDQPTFSNSKGEVSFAGGIFNPGFKGQGKVGSLILAAKQPVKTRLTFSSDTSVLLNDGRGTAIPLNLAPIEVEIP